MSQPSDDFSHLPTVDTAGRGVSKDALWQRHRREKPAETRAPEELVRLDDPNEAMAEQAHNTAAFEPHDAGPELLESEPTVHVRDGGAPLHEQSRAESWMDSGLRVESSPAQPADAEPEPAEIGEPAPADHSEEIRRSAKRALMVTIGLHVAVALTLALMHTAGINTKPAEIVAIAGVDQQEAPTSKKVTTATPQAAPMPSVSPMLATGVSEFAMPKVDFDTSATQLNLGSSFGSFGMGGGAGAGAKISFLGNTANGRNIVYVVDLSSSMLARSMIAGSQDSVSRFELLQKELRSSIGRLSSVVQYQILFFADYAIAHDVVDTKDFSKLQTFDWRIRAGQRDVKIPSFKYLQGDRINVTRSQKIIEESEPFGGTNWGSGLRMALNGNPKPDVIFFMTDGDSGDEQGWANDVTENNSRGKRTIIHTTAMMVPGAADALDEIARRNGGTFTIVMPSGKILTGAEYFKQRGR